MSNSTPNLAKRLIKRILQTDIAQKLRFTGASGVSTLIDYIVFFSALSAGITIVPSQIIAQITGFASNFLLQRNWVFTLGRSNTHVLLRLSITVPGGLILGAASVYFLSQIPVMYEHKILVKVITTIILFAYNYYSRRWVFEQRNS
jgi:putative flippase GtrA